MEMDNLEEFIKKEVSDILEEEMSEADVHSIVSRQVGNVYEQIEESVNTLQRKVGDTQMGKKAIKLLRALKRELQDNT